MAMTNRSFDFVIVGAGPSAVGLLYGLLEQYKDLSSLPNFTVAIIERGAGPPNDASTQSPSNWFEAAHKLNSKSVSHISSEITGRIMDIPIGKGLGGSSNINACLCTFPRPQDFDCWPEPWKSSMWGSIQTIQKILEDNKTIHHGLKNMQNVSSPYNEKAPFDLSSNVPTLVVEDSLGHLVRKNYYDALLVPLFLQFPHLKKNLVWILETEVQRLILRQHEVIGVECYTSPNNMLWKIYATRQVILCAGAIETPALLLVSGIGAHDELSGVGRHLKDQICLARAYLTPWRGNKRTSTNGIAALGHLHVAENIFQLAIVDSAGHSQILPSALAMSMRWKWNLMQWASLWDQVFDGLFVILKTVLKFAIAFSPLGFILRHFTTTTLLFLMSPCSEGSVSIKPNNKGGRMTRRDITVQVDAGYLRDNRDLRALKEGWTASHAKEGCLEVFPRFFFQPLGLFSVDWFHLYAKFFLLPYFHWCGTCIMQTEQNTDWVVDRDLRLRQHRGLSICDASVFPTMLSSPPALACTALGYVFSKILLSKNNLCKPTM